MGDTTTEHVFGTEPARLKAFLAESGAGQDIVYLQIYG